MTARGPSRKLALAAPPAALALLLAALVEPADAPSRTATAAKESAVEAVESVSRRGAPVAVLERRTWLRRTPNGKRVARLPKRTKWKSPRVFAVVGAKGRWLEVLATELPNGRTAWIPLAATELVANPWAVDIDLSTRLVRVRNGGRLVKRFRVAIGKPRTPTPRGTFAVTDKLEIVRGSAAYGCCALALTGKQPHIEPGWRGGNRLAIHVTRLTYTIGRAASFGCLRARDRDALGVIRRVYLGTLVTIRR